MQELMSLIDESDEFSISAIEAEEFLFGGPYGAAKEYDEADEISVDFTVTIHSTIREDDSDDKNDFRIN